MFTDLLKENRLSQHDAWFANIKAIKSWIYKIGHENEDDGASYYKNTEVQSIRKQWHLSNQIIIYMEVTTYLYI